MRMENNDLSVWASVTIKDGVEKVVMNEVAHGGGTFMIDSR